MRWWFSTVPSAYALNPWSLVSRGTPFTIAVDASSGWVAYAATASSAALARQSAACGADGIIELASERSPAFQAHSSARVSPGVAMVPSGRPQ